VVVVEEGAPDFVELRVMSLCRFLIIANSSFSWWAAYLSRATSSPSADAGEGEREAGVGEREAAGDEEEEWQSGAGRVVAPAAWFGEDGPAWEPGDLFPPDWIVV
jgi:hypothetical protein